MKVYSKISVRPLHYHSPISKPMPAKSSRVQSVLAGITDNLRMVSEKC